MEEEKVFDKEAVGRISTLEAKLYKMKDEKIVRGKLDTESNMLFIVDDDDKMTGYAFSVNEVEGEYEEPEEEEKPKKSFIQKLMFWKKDETSDDESEEGEDGENSEIVEKAGMPTGTKYLLGGILIGLAVFAMALMGVLLSQKNKALKDANSALAEAEDNIKKYEDIAAGLQEQLSHSSHSVPVLPSSDDSEHEVLPGITAVNVLQVKEMMIPGTQITADKLEIVPISADEYNSINLSVGAGSRLCLENDLNTILGMYCNGYIPAGQYLTYATVRNNDGISHNPWYKVDEEKTVTVALTPEQAAAINAGDLYDIKIVIQRVIQSPVEESTAAENQEGETSAAEQPPAPQEESSLPEGLGLGTQVQESYVVYTYELKGLVVTDLLNAKGERISPFYEPFYGMPETVLVTYFRDQIEAGKLDTSSLVPAQAVFLFTADQLIEMPEIREGKATIQLIDTTKEATDPEPNAKYISGYKAVKKALDRAAAYFVEPEPEESTAAEVSSNG